jgi:hypothetical protein
MSAFQWKGKTWPQCDKIQREHHVYINDWSDTCINQGMSKEDRTDSSLVPQRQHGPDDTFIHIKQSN